MSNQQNQRRTAEKTSSSSKPVWRQGRSNSFFAPPLPKPDHTTLSVRNSPSPARLGCCSGSQDPRPSQAQTAAPENETTTPTPMTPPQTWPTNPKPPRNAPHTKGPSYEGAVLLRALQGAPKAAGRLQRRHILQGQRRFLHRDRTAPGLGLD